MNPGDNSAPSPSTEDETKRKINVTKAWSVSELLRIPDSENSWIIEGLLRRRGSQMLLAAAPKSGKSLLASEIALALAVPFKEGEKRYLFNAILQKEPHFPGLEICKPPNGTGWCVLFLSLEMREAEVSIRLRQQLGRFGIPAPKLKETDPEPDELKFPLTHVFGLTEPNSNEIIQDLQIVETKTEGMGHPTRTIDGKHFKPLMDLIPSAIIADMRQPRNTLKSFRRKRDQTLFSRRSKPRATPASVARAAPPVASIVASMAIRSKKQVGQKKLDLGDVISLTNFTN